MTVALLKFARRCAQRLVGFPSKRAGSAPDLADATSFVSVGGLPFRLDGDALVSGRLEILDGSFLRVDLERIADVTLPAPSPSGEDERARLLRIAKCIRIRLSVA